MVNIGVAVRLLLPDVAGGVMPTGVLCAPPFVTTVLFGPWGSEATVGVPAVGVEGGGIDCIATVRFIHA